MKIEDILAQALAALEQGDSLESVLAQYPDVAEELRELLHLAQAVRDAHPPRLADTPFRQGLKAVRARARLQQVAQQAYVAGHQAPTTPSLPQPPVTTVASTPMASPAPDLRSRRTARRAFLLPRLSTLMRTGTLALILFVFVAGAFTLMRSARSSLPGDLLYPAKRTVENAQGALMTSAGEEATWHAQQVERRLAESLALQRLGEPVPPTLAREIDADMDAALAAATDLPPRDRLLFLTTWLRALDRLQAAPAEQNSPAAAALAAAIQVVEAASLMAATATPTPPAALAVVSEEPTENAMPATPSTSAATDTVAGSTTSVQTTEAPAEPTEAAGVATVATEAVGVAMVTRAATNTPVEAVAGSTPAPTRVVASMPGTPRPTATRTPRPTATLTPQPVSSGGGEQEAPTATRAQQSQQSSRPPARPTPTWTPRATNTSTATPTVRPSAEPTRSPTPISGPLVLGATPTADRSTTGGAGVAEIPTEFLATATPTVAAGAAAGEPAITGATPVTATLVTEIPAETTLDTPPSAITSTPPLTVTLTVTGQPTVSASTPTATATFTPTMTATVTPTARPTLTSALDQTSTVEATGAPATLTPVPTVTPTTPPSATPSPTILPSATPTPTPTATQPPTVTPTPSPSLTPSPVPSATPTLTPTAPADPADIQPDNGEEPGN